MKVKQRIINYTIQIVKELMECNLPITTAKDIYMLYKELDEHYQFAVKEEMKIVVSLGGEVMPDGSIQFKENSEDCSNKFIEKRNELNTLDVEIVAKPIHISIADVEGARLRPMDIVILEPFIIFE